MLFWILIVVSVTITIIVFAIFATSEDHSFGAVAVKTFSTLAISLLTSLIILLIVGTIVFLQPSSKNVISTKDYSMNSIGGDTVEGKYYAAIRNDNSQPSLVFMYTQQDSDGKDYSELEIISLKDNTKFYFDVVETPYVVVHTVEVGADWVAPWSPNTYLEYEFHIPKDSFLGDYSLIELNEEGKDW